jgi:pimeloyl-ACP methyl ester carboxylesterase
MWQCPSNGDAHDRPEYKIASVQITPESHVVESFDGTPIHYDLYTASGAECLVLVIPGFWRDRRHPSMQRLADFLLQRGYSVAIVDVRGHGESGGVYGFNLHEHEDVAVAARAILDEHACERISLLGFSVGGAIAIATAARHHDLPLASLLLISSVANFSMIKPRLNPLHFHRHIALTQAMRRPRFDWQFVRREKLKGTEDVQQVHVPISLIHVKKDWLIGHPHSVALYEAANEPKELHIIDIPGNYHADRIFSVAGDQIEPLVEEFLERTLRRGGGGDNKKAAD